MDTTVFCFYIYNVVDKFRIVVREEQTFSLVEFGNFFHFFCRQCKVEYIDMFHFFIYKTHFSYPS